jgi:osmotically-inducible protein OsmY
MRNIVVTSLSLLLSGCLTVAQTSYETATDERSVATQKADTQAALTIKKRLLESDVKGTGGLDVYCRNGVVVLTGVVEAGSAAGREAVAIAGKVDGVKRVETYYVPSRPSMAGDLLIKQKISARMVGDGDLKAGQVDMSVLAGHVVLVGVVNRAEKVTKIIGHARATEGVVAVKSFIQVGAP